MAKVARDDAPVSMTVKAIQDSWHDDFKRIGSAMPPIGNNIDSFLWELTVAQFLERQAKTRVEVAKELCVKNGIMPDHKQYPREPGVSEMVASGKLCALTLITKQPTTNFDTKKFLLRLYLLCTDKRKQIEKLEAECRGTNAVPHTFMSQLVVKE